MAEQEQHAGTCTYADRLVQLTPEAIRIPWFHFPCGTKRVRLADIERVEILPSRLATGTYRIWGSGDLRTWFGLDWRRPSRKWIYVFHVRSKWKRVGLTVEDNERFQAALQANGIELQPGSVEEAEKFTRSAFLFIMGIILSLLALLFIGLSIPLIAGRVAPHGTDGRWAGPTLSDPRIWYAANRFSGMLMLIMGILAAAIGPRMIVKRRTWPLWAGVIALIGVQVLSLMTMGISIVYANTLTGSDLDRESRAMASPSSGSDQSAPPQVVSNIDAQGRIVDRIDYPFLNDPGILGQWKSVDFVSSIGEFTPGKRTWPSDLFLKEVSFLPNGRVTPQVGWTWTKGLVLNQSDRTASRYEIRNVEGKSFLFLEWKSGDYTLRHRKPAYYVLQR